MIKEYKILKKSKFAKPWISSWSCPGLYPLPSGYYFMAAGVGSRDKDKKI